MNQTAHEPPMPMLSATLSRWFWHMQAVTALTFSASDSIMHNVCAVAGPVEDWKIRSCTRPIVLGCKLHI